MSSILDKINNILLDYSIMIKNMLPRLPQEALAEIKTERQIIERGYMSYEDLRQWMEFKPYIIPALTMNNTITGKEVLKYMKDYGVTVPYADVKRALLNYEIKMLEGE